MFNKVVLVTAALASFGLFVWHIFPNTTAATLLKVNLITSGLQSQTIDTKFGDIHYIEGGSGDTVVLVHGIYARKEHWVELARRLKEDYRVILIDVPGFGSNQPLPKNGYRLQNQSKAFGEIARVLELDRFHIAANSMGAQIVAPYALENPSRVTSLALIGSPLGVTSPQRSDMELAIEKGHRPLVVVTEDDFVARTEWLFPEAPYIPQPILDMWMHEEAHKAELNVRIWEESQDFSEITPLDQIASKLKVPTLVLWCREDRIFHISGADVLERTLPNGEIVRMEDCGHVPMLDQAQLSYEHYNHFLDSVSLHRGKSR